MPLSVLKPQSGFWDVDIRSRIDDFVLITCRDITIKAFVHVGAFVSMSGPCKVTIDEYATLSHGVRIFTGSDDYSGKSMVNPLVPVKFRPGLVTGDVHIGRGVVVGPNTVIMPGVTLHDYCAIGANSFVKRSVPSFQIWAGTPARYLKRRKRDCAELEKGFPR